MATAIRWFLTLLLIALAWHAGEIGPWTSFILALSSISHECAAYVLKGQRKQIEFIQGVITTILKRKEGVVRPDA